jgi:glucose/arabinose dehydrogenase
LIGKNLLDNLFVQSQSDLELLAFLRVGRAADDPANTSGIAMPAMGGNPNLSQNDLNLLVVYLRHLQTTLEENWLNEQPSEFNPSPYEWRLVVDHLDNPLGLTHAGDGSGRLFLWEQGGTVLVFEDGQVRFPPLLDLSQLVPDEVYEGGYTEQGLLGLAFHPDFEQNGRFFVSSINRAGDSVLLRYEADPAALAPLDPKGGVELLQVDQPFADHNGGTLAFGGDGYLYWAFGDGGRPDQPNDNSQNPGLALGKMLRLEVEGETYRVPPDNPFLDDPSYLPEIWALGLRNPWKFSFDRQTGDLYIGDVGQWLYEEINFQAADSRGGENYGWSAYEAFEPYLTDVTPLGEVTMPALSYNHERGCSVTGGYVYRGAALADLQGQYIYGDFCNGVIWLAERDSNGLWGSSVLMDTGFSIVSFGEDEAGELYLVDIQGAVYQLVARE